MEFDNLNEESPFERKPLTPDERCVCPKAASGRPGVRGTVLYCVQHEFDPMWCCCGGLLDGADQRWIDGAQACQCGMPEPALFSLNMTAQTDKIARKSVKKKIMELDDLNERFLRWRNVDDPCSTCFGRRSIRKLSSSIVPRYD